MSEKTEKATPKKRRDARKEGNVFKSIEVNNSATMICSVLAFSLMWKGMLENLKDFFTYMISDGYRVFGGSIDEGVFSQLLIEGTKVALSVCAPLILMIMFTGIASNLAQVGILFVPKSIQPKLERISFLSGFKKLFSMKTAKDLVKAILKVIIIFYIGYLLIHPLILDIPKLLDRDINELVDFGVSTSLNMSFKLLIAMVSIAVLDYVFQRTEYAKKLKMTKQEVKDEYKNTEGDPQIKSRIKSVQREMAMSRMMSQVPEADVVITNPTHYAVALRYNKEKDSAPTVIAKGADLIAQRIKEIAKENKIEIVESKQLAQSLYKSTEIGDEIPFELYSAVAEILAYIYSLKGKGKK